MTTNGEGPHENGRRAHRLPEKRTPPAPEERRGPGRPTALNDETANAIVNAVRTGSPLHTAVRFAGIDDGTLRNWRRQQQQAVRKTARQRNRPERRVVEFFRDLDEALASHAIRMQATVFALATDPEVSDETRLKAATWSLQHSPLTKDDYAPRTEVTGRDGEPLELSGDQAFAALLGLQVSVEVNGE